MSAGRTFILLVWLASGFSVGQGHRDVTHGTDGLCWLLHSPQRQYLSDGGEMALQLGCRPDTGFRRAALDGTEVGLRTSRDQAMAAANIPVNDPRDDVPEHTTQSETTTAVFNQTVLVAFVDTGQFLPRRAGTSSLVGYARSADGGATFLDLGTVPPHPLTLGLSDPSLGVDSRGVFYISTLQQVPAARSGERAQSYVGVSKSIDGVASFSPAQLIMGTGPATLHFQDKPLLAADNTGAARDRSVYVAWTEFSPAGSRILLVRSTDGGVAFASPRILSRPGDSVQGATPAVGPDGELYVMWLAFEDSSFISWRIRRSDDGGESFSAEHVIARLAATGDERATSTCRRKALNGNIRQLELPSLAVDRSRGIYRGTVYAVFTGDPDGAGTDGSDVYVSYSRDGGASWVGPTRVHDDTTRSDQFQPSVAVAPDGTVAVMFYDRRLDRANLAMDTYLALSRGGDLSFRNVRVTERSFPVPPTAVGGQNFDDLRGPCYMGDYNQMAVDKQFAYLAWGDNRRTLRTPRFPEGRPDPDVYFSTVPLRGEEPR